MLRRRLYVVAARSFFGFALLLILLSQAGVSISSWPGIKGKLIPELDSKALSISASLSAKIARALDYGVPFEGLTGVDTFFEEVLRQTDGISYLALSRLDGSLIVGKGLDEQALQRGISAALKKIENNLGKPMNIALPGGDRGEYTTFRNTAAKVLQHEKIEMGLVHVGVDPGYAARKVGDLRYDVMIVMLASLLIGFEILLAVLTRNFIAPLKTVADRLEGMAKGDFRNRPAAHNPEVSAALSARLERLCARVNEAYAGLLASLQGLPQSANAAGAHSLSAALASLRSRFLLDATADAASSATQDIVRVRILTFVFMFASMLSRPFLPVYLREVADQSTLPPELSASIPITVYLAVMALCMPYAGRCSDAHGRRNSYMLGALLMAVGLCGTALAWNFWVLLAARAIEGAGYAFLFMSCQGYVIDNSRAENRSSGVATFISAVMMAEVCAPAVGGVLADSMGFRGVLATAMVLSLIAIPLAWNLLADSSAGRSLRRTGGSGERGADGAGIGSLLRNYRFMTLSVFAAMPAKILHSGFLIFLTPVVLSSFGSSMSEIGRFAIVYGIIALVAMPLFSRVGDRYHCHLPLVIAGGLISGCGMLPLVFDASPLMVLLGIVGLGLGQSMSISSQLTLITRTVEATNGGSGVGSALGVFRLLERVGGALGPLAAGAIALQMGAVAAITVLGAVMLAATLICFLMIAGLRKGSTRTAP